MTYPVEYTERARAHIVDALDWIADRSLMAAEQWLEDLEGAIDSLSVNPERFLFASENATHDIEIRQMLFRKGRGQYRVLFTIGAGTVVVLDVRHSMQNWLAPGELDS